MIHQRNFKGQKGKAYIKKTFLGQMLHEKMQWTILQVSAWNAREVGQSERERTRARWCGVNKRCYSKQTSGDLRLYLPHRMPPHPYSLVGHIQSVNDRKNTFPTLHLQKQDQNLEVFRDWLLHDQLKSVRGYIVDWPWLTSLHHYNFQNTPELALPK